MITPGAGYLFADIAYPAPGLSWYGTCSFPDLKKERSITYTTLKSITFSERTDEYITLILFFYDRGVNNATAADGFFKNSGRRKKRMEKISMADLVRRLQAAQSTPQGVAKVRDQMVRDLQIDARKREEHISAELATFPSRAVEVVKSICNTGADRSPVLIRMAEIWDSIPWKRGDGVLMAGGMGIGKTVAATYCAYRVAYCGGTCLYVPGYDLPRYADNPATALASLLVIDEIHRAAESRPWVLNIARGWIDGRYGAKRHTVIIGTGSLGSISAVLGPEIVDRIPPENRIYFSGESRRGK